MGAGGREDVARAGAARRPVAPGGGEQSRLHREDDRRRHVRGLRRSGRCNQRHGFAAAGVARPCGNGRTRAPDTLRAAPRRRRAPRRGPVRKPRQPRRANHEGGARRPDTALAGRGRSCPRTPAAADLAARSRFGAPARSGDVGARVPAAPSPAAAGIPRAALARGDAQQPAATGHVVRRAPARARRSERDARWNAAADAAGHGRPREDPSLAADRRRRAGKISGRRVVHRPRTDQGSGARSERCRAGAERARRGRASRSCRR